MNVAMVLLIIFMAASRSWLAAATPADAAGYDAVYVLDVIRRAGGRIGVRFRVPTD